MSSWEHSKPGINPPTFWLVADQLYHLCQIATEEKVLFPFFLK